MDVYARSSPSCLLHSVLYKNNAPSNVLHPGQVIFLLLGSFVLASALSKHHIAKRLSTAVLAQVGTHPSVILLAIMMAALITSTFMSNVTAPTLCYGILHVRLSLWWFSDQC